MCFSFKYVDIHRIPIIYTVEKYRNTNTPVGVFIVIKGSPMSADGSSLLVDSPFSPEWS